MKTVRVAAAIIRSGHKIFATQRGYGEFKDGWEFPGGKIEAGESAKQALAREISEELSLRAHVGEKITTTTHEYDFATIELTTYYCEILDGTPQLLDHDETRWVRKEEALSLQWAPADIHAVSMVVDRL